MELLLRIELPAGVDAREHDVRVDAEPGHTIDELVTSIARHCGLRTDTTRVPAVRLATGEILTPGSTIEQLGLCSGERIGIGGVPIESKPPAPESGVTVDVLAGPDAGQSRIIGIGTFTVGRDSACDIALQDPTVSSQHAQITVADDGTVLVVANPGAANGVFVDGAHMPDAAPIEPNNVVQMGASAIVVRPFHRGRLGERDQLGQVPFLRTPYRPSKLREQELPALGDVPVRPEPSRFAFLSATLPLIAGLTMFAFSGQPQFLVLTALTPLSVAGNWWEQRRRGSQRYEFSLERFRTRVEKRRAEVRAALADERARRVRAAPDVADLSRRAELRTIDLWARGRSAPDFLTVRLGLGEETTRISVEPEHSGDEEHRVEAEEAAIGHDRLAGVPITLSLQELGVVAVHGATIDVAALASSIIVQSVCLHSPEDLIVVGAVSPDRGMVEWMKWLPHARSATSPVGGAHLTTDRAAADRLLRELIEVAEFRVRSTDRAIDRRWPWLLAVLDDSVSPDPALVSQLLDHCPQAGISAVWLTNGEAKVVRQAEAVVHCEALETGRLSTLWFADPDRAITKIETERVHGSVRDRVARALAPVRDASVAHATTAIPRIVPLFAALGIDTATPEWVAANYAADRGYTLAAPVGTSAEGQFVLDLVAHGPHALIGGTSGSGKSELLQSIVASLISQYPPTRLNLLFVDYKGGASSTVFRSVPHTVGYVTNLDAALSLRALTSLRAELNRRMQLLEGRAKDLEEMIKRYPDEAPPSLVIVVDEFATLVREVEGFVTGIVDIAQRGRSLGIHLILATQRPSGSVDDNILANTNLRIALRMLDSSESSSIIGTTEAAEIPVPLKGRAYARLGPRELIAFQSAFTGARSAGDDTDRQVVVADFTVDGREAIPTPPAPGEPADDRTQLDVLIASVQAASHMLSLEPGREPWREVLPDHIDLDTLRKDERTASARQSPGRLVAIGLVDEPEQQNQFPAVVDLEDGGGLLVFGAGGTGKTTLLRTIAASAVIDDDAGGEQTDVVLYGIDCASRALRALEALPQCAAVATGDDLEVVTRIITLLTAELGRRRELLASRQADSLAGWNSLAGSEHLPRVLLLVDGYANLNAALSTPGPAEGSGSIDWLEMFHRLVTDGRSVGIHTVVTADRRGAVPGLLMSTIANRLVLRQADASGYADLGVAGRAVPSRDLAPGRGFVAGSQLVQVACVAAEGDGAAQAAALASLGARLRAVIPETLQTCALDERIESIGIDTPPLHVALGRRDVTLAPVVVELTHSNFLIAGPPRSGRSTTLRTVAEQLAMGGAEVWTVGTHVAGLQSFGKATRAAFGNAEEILPMLGELIATLDVPAALPRVVVIDDLDLLDDPSFQPVFHVIARDRRSRVVASIETRALNNYTPDLLLTEMRKARRMLILQPDSALDVFTVTGVRPPIRPGLRRARGRGVLLVDREASVVQVALPEGE